MLDRTEEQILAQDPIELKLGDKTYPVKVLTIKKARQWRKVMIEEVQKIALIASGEAGTQEAFLGGLGFMFLDFPEKMADLVFSYADELDRDLIEGTATEEQLCKAFGKIVEVAFPFVQELQTISGTLKLAAAFPTSVKSTRLH